MWQVFFSESLNYLLTADTRPAALMPLFNEQQQGNPILPSQKYRIPLLFYKEKHEHSTTTVVVVALWKWKVFLLGDTLTHHHSLYTSSFCAILACFT